LKHPVFFTLQTIEKEKCTVGVQLARSIVNGLVHEFEELNLFCLAALSKESSLIK